MGVVGWGEIVRAVQFGREGRPAADVVCMNVGVGHPYDPGSELVSKLPIRLGVSRGIDDECLTITGKEIRQ